MQFTVCFDDWLFTYQYVIALHFHFKYGLLIFISRRRTAGFYIVFPTMPRTSHIDTVIFIFYKTQPQWPCFMQACVGERRYFIVEMEQSDFMRTQWNYLL